MLSKRVAQNFTIGMQKDIVLPIIAESLQIARDGGGGGETYILQLTKKHLIPKFNPYKRLKT